MSDTVVYRFTGIGEARTTISQLLEGDVFRRDGSKEWWRCTGAPILSESNGWQVNCVQQELLLENK